VQWVCCTWGAVLFINGLMLVGAIPGKSAGILNFFVGGMQVIFPTLIILGADGDLSVIFGAAGLYLFGFTYLYVAILQFTGISGEGLGWFSLFVVFCATVVGVLQFTLVDDPVFGVIWLIWAVLWFPFFLVLGRGRGSLTRTRGTAPTPRRNRPNPPSRPEPFEKGPPTPCPSMSSVAQTARTSS
jgi:hypothetical protein